MQEILSLPQMERPVPERAPWDHFPTGRGFFRAKERSLPRAQGAGLLASSPTRGWRDPLVCPEGPRRGKQAGYLGLLGVAELEWDVFSHSHVCRVAQG